MLQWHVPMPGYVQGFYLRIGSSYLEFTDLAGEC